MRQTRLADGDQIAFRVQRFHESRAGLRPERRNAKIAAVANLARCDGVHHLARKFGQKFGGRHQRLGNPPFFRERGQLFQRARRFDFEIARREPAQVLQIARRSPAPGPRRARCCANTFRPNNGRGSQPRILPASKFAAPRYSPAPPSDRPAVASAPVHTRACLRFSLPKPAEASARTRLATGPAPLRPSRAPA